MSPVHVVAGDIGGTGRADLAIDFGTGIGLWTFRNNTTWMPLNAVSADRLALADRDGNWKDEIIVDVGPTYRVWQYVNDTASSAFHPLSPEIGSWTILLVDCTNHL
jgi:hypothetical protein